MPQDALRTHVISAHSNDAVEHSYQPEPRIPWRLFWCGYSRLTSISLR